MTNNYESSYGLTKNNNISNNTNNLNSINANNLNNTTNFNNKSNFNSCNNSNNNNFNNKNITYNNKNVIPSPDQSQKQSLSNPYTLKEDINVIKNQATINIGTIGHVAHGKSTLVKQISGVNTIKYKSELERNITIKLGYANAKIYECNNINCSRPGRYKSFGSDEMRDMIGCRNCWSKLSETEYLKKKESRLEMLRVKKRCKINDKERERISSSLNEEESENVTGSENDNLTESESITENENTSESDNDIPSDNINNNEEDDSDEDDSSEIEDHYSYNGYLTLIRHVSFVDCPGHDVLMATMLTGTAIMDGAILLIASNENCPQPQTQEHLFAIEIMDLDKIIIVQNKIDLISREKAIEHREQICEFVKGTKAENSPVIPASCQMNVNVDAVLDFIVNYIPVPERNNSLVQNLSEDKKNWNLEENKRNFDCGNKKNLNFNENNDLHSENNILNDDQEKFNYGNDKNTKVCIEDSLHLGKKLSQPSDKRTKLVIIRSFDINRPGCVIEDLNGGIIGGSLLTGTLQTNDEIEIRPGHITSTKIKNGDTETIKFSCKPYLSKITSLKAEKNHLSKAYPGGLIGVGTQLDPFLCRADKLVGMVMGKKGEMPDIFEKIVVKYRLFKKIAGMSGPKSGKIMELCVGEAYLLNVGSTTAGSLVDFVDLDNGIVKFSVSRPICCDLGERIAISRKISNHWRLIGYGQIVDGTIVEPIY